MFCTNCGSALPEKGAKFCPNCGTPLFQAEPLIPASEPVPEVSLEESVSEAPLQTASEAAEVFEKAPEEVEKAAEELPEALEEAVETFEELPQEEPEAVPEPPAEPLPAETPEVPAPNPVPAPDPVPEPVSPVSRVAEPSRHLHFTAIVSIVFTALSCLFFFLTLLALLVNMHPAIMILSSLCLLFNTPLAFGFGFAAFIVGLKRRHPGTWIIGLVAAILAVLSFFVGIFALIGSIIYAAV